MSKKNDHNKESNSGLLSKVKEKSAQVTHQQDNKYVPPQEFQSKTPKKPNQTFFVAKNNKPAKYTKDSNFLSYLIYRIGKDDASGLAAQLSYYFMLSLFPMLLFLLSLLPLFKIDRNKIVDMIAKNAPASTADLLTGIIGDIMKNASGSILSVGLILALWSASNGMTALMNAFNVAYDVEDGRNPILLKLISVLFTVIMGAVFIAAMILPVFGQQIGHLLFGPLGLDSQVKWIFNILSYALPFVVIFLLFATLYTLAPNIKIKWKSVLPGALFTSIVWIVGTAAFGLYVSNFANYSKTYGSIGGIIVLMLWLYITGFIIIVGAEINAIINQRRTLKHADSLEEHQFKVSDLQNPHSERS
ncbi:YihY/virulence factor BrkB family protein [Staphylococcus debuckii]|uniref:YihY/virulence factor BrkB family protein n=1 Tax=Staphylococcus debuckii TaxID=2044912 RepID=UPI000F430515|nr:YihY/virulence factor BrkB family protein [Staphylococcus debuckii]AYU55603.1 YihY/virulence factor BrkB family protein [Staphylococcus debuckii]